MKRILWATALATAACGSVKHDEAGDGGAGDFSLATAPGRPLVRQGGSVDVEVTADRQGVSGPIEVTADGLPDGVTAQPLTIADGEESGVLTLSAAGGAAQGEAAVSLTGEAPDATGAGAFALLVGGEPGSFDDSFADGGKLVSNFDIAVVAQRGIALQPDGKIVGTGSTGDQAITYRLLPDGSPDDGFGSGGVVTTGLGESTGGLVPVVLADGRIVVAGWGGPLDPDPGYDSALFGYTAAGALDGGFGSSGTVSLNLGAGYDEFHGLVEDPDGGLLAAGIEFAGGTSTLRRYDGQGGVDGAYTIAPAASAGVQAALLQSDGKTVLVGGSGGDLWLERHLAGGEPDGGFDGDGMVTTDLGDPADKAIGVVEVAGGKLVVGAISGGKAAVARYNGNGSLDLTFGEGGKVVTPIALDTRGLNAVAIDSQGRVLLAGFVTAPARLPAVVRLTAEGEPDAAFGDGGLVVLDLGVLSDSQTTAFGVVVDPDDRVLVACDVGAAGAQRASVVRLWP
jgi:uncharacterized delta-60 repeat protein